MKRKLSLKAIVILFGTILVIVVALSLGTISSFISYNSVNQQVNKQIVDNITAHKATVESTIEMYKSEINVAAGISQHYDPYLSIAQKKTILANTAKLTHFKDFSIADENGKTYSDTDISKREYFISAMNGTSVISSPVIRLTDNSIVIMAAAKIPDPNFNGAIYGGIDYDVFSNLVSNIQVEQTGFGFIVDKDGNVVAHKEKDYVANMTNFITLAAEDSNYAALGEVVQQMQERGEDVNASIRDISYNGQTYRIGYAPINGDEQWSLAIMVPKIEIMMEFYRSINWIVGATLLLLVLGIIALYIIAEKISSPVVFAAENMAKFAEGDTGVQVDLISSIKEVDDLSNALGDTVNQVNTYINDLNKVLGAMAQKDLTVMPEADYRGGYWMIRHSLYQILTSFRTIFTDLNHMSDEIYHGAEQIASGSSSLSEQSVLQTNNLAALKSGIKNISEQVHKTVENTEKARELTEIAVKEVNIGNNKMAEMLASINEISKASDEISDINKTIEDIAFQTNILALNASVEAARAGAAGKGFAVVAGEVRNLAIKSAEAAKVTKQLIENSIRAVSKGTNIADDTAKSLNSIVSEVMQVNSLVDEITVSAANQSKDITEISDSISAISDAIYSTSVTSEEYASTSKAFVQQANHLKEIVEEFRLDN